MWIIIINVCQIFSLWYSMIRVIFVRCKYLLYKYICCGELICNLCTTCNYHFPGILTKHFNICRSINYTFSYFWNIYVTIANFFSLFCKRNFSSRLFLHQEFIYFQITLLRCWYISFLIWQSCNLRIFCLRSFEILLRICWPSNLGEVSRRNFGTLFNGKTKLRSLS